MWTAKAVTPNNNFSVLSKTPLSHIYTKAVGMHFSITNVGNKFHQNIFKWVLMQNKWSKRGFPIAVPLRTSAVAIFPSQKSCIKKTVCKLKRSQATYIFSSVVNIWSQNTWWEHIRKALNAVRHWDNYLSWLIIKFSMSSVLFLEPWFNTEEDY